MTPEEADNAQQWEGMDGAIAWQLIDRHADDWGDIREMMNAWLRANVAAAVKVERAACADCVPKNWCDPMLTGTDNVITGTVRETAVEAVLNAVRARIIKRSNA